MVGKTLSHYKILEELGRGGMGIVYKAEDTRLDRTVAIKVLPSAALTSEDDRARFYREAKAAAQLHHPHIASVFEIDEAVPSDAPHGTGPSPFIAMEYISGDTLSKRIEGTPLKFKEAIQIARQIAMGLEAAHEKNIVHRDIKSGNVMLTIKGEAKVLDFGLAQTAQSTKLTQMGSTLGTISYMSPEQARGEEVDTRTDIWALGVVLFEMITGQRPFKGEYDKAIIYGILNEDPPPLTDLRTGAPLKLEWIVQKMLSKKAVGRYQNISEVLVDLNAAMDDRSSTNTTESRQSSKSASVRKQNKLTSIRLVIYLVIGIAFVLAAVALGASLAGRTDETGPVRTFSVDLPDAAPEAIPVISTSGAFIAYRTTQEAVPDTPGGAVRVKNLRNGRALDIANTDGALHFGFSPDDRRLFITMNAGLYIADLPLRLDDQTGGREPTLVHSDTYPMAGWGDDGTLYYAASGQLWQLRPDGSRPEPLVMSDSEEHGYITGFGIQISGKDGKALVTIGPRPYPVARIFGIPADSVSMATVDLRSGVVRDLGINLTRTVYVPTGHLLFFAGTSSTTNQLVARPFDINNGEFQGPASPLWTTSEGGHHSFSFDKFGTLVRQAAATNELFRNTVMILDETGLRDIGIVEGNYGRARVSPDGERIAVEDRSQGDAFQILTISLDDGFIRPLTFDGSNSSPVWSADGRSVTYIHGPTDGYYEIRRTPISGNGETETLTRSTDFLLWPDWDGDGNRLVYSAQSLSSGLDIWMYDAQSRESQVIVELPGDQRRPIISPDGRFVAYRDEGRMIIKEIDGNLVLVASETNAVDARWSADGQFLFSKNDEESIIYALPVSVDPTFRTTGQIERRFDLGRYFEYDPFPDGRRFIAVPMWAESDETNFEVVNNWFQELRDRAPSN